MTGGLKVKDKFLIVAVIQNFTGYSELQESISPKFKTMNSSSILVHPLETWVLSSYTVHVLSET